MSGHLMNTVNPEAANGIDESTLPDKGDIVIFVERPGAGRRGRQEFPAMVMHRNSSRGPTGLDLLVVYDSRDTIDQESVQEQGEQYQTFCWRRREPAAQMGLTEVEHLTLEVALLKEKVFGAYNEPPKSLMDYLADFEARLKKLDDALKDDARKKGRKAG